MRAAAGCNGEKLNKPRESTMGLFRSKSCSLPDSPKHSPAPYQYDSEEDEEEEEGNTEFVRLRRRKSRSCADINDSSPFNLIGAVEKGKSRWRRSANGSLMMMSHPPLLGFVLTALRKSLLLTCSVDSDDVVIGGAADLEISWPTDLCHVAHVTFDPLDGFLGLPLELQYDLPPKVPSASVNVFGVSAHSMQCSYDPKGNCVPTILLMLQDRLYSEGGLRAEGIFRINAENGQDENVRNDLSRGFLPSAIDVHCLAGLIKAWFRELPDGVLDCLTPDQVMHCNTEEECTQLVKLLPLAEAALLDWAINLMADVVLHEHFNKMNPRNIAMVFAPNMTQMADPLTALIHAVQVMNLLKTLINIKVREREKSDSAKRSFSSAAESPDHKQRESPGPDDMMKCMQALDEHCSERSESCRLDGSLECLDSEKCSYGVKGDGSDADDARKVSECFPDRISEPSALSGSQSLKSSFTEEGLNDESGIQRRGGWKLGRHHVFQLNRQVKKKAADIRSANCKGGEEAWL